MAKSKASVIAGGNQGAREEHDFYPTPAHAVESILAVEPLEGSIYECACGDGAICKVLEKFYPESHIHASDLIDRGYGTSGVDFLTHNYGEYRFDNIITNPPYRYATEFVEKALETFRTFEYTNPNALLLDTNPMAIVEIFEKPKSDIDYCGDKERKLYYYQSLNKYKLVVWDGYNNEPLFKF